MSELPIPSLIYRLSSRRGFPVIFLALVLGVFALSPTARAVDPPLDGGYPNNNTAEGTDALFNLMTRKRQHGQRLLSALR